MTQNKFRCVNIQEFTNLLDLKKYRYEINGGEIIVNHNRGLTLKKLKSIPPFVFFNNKGYVELDSLEVVPEGTRFENKGDLNISSVKSLPPGIIFKNTGYVVMESLEYLPDGVEFRNTPIPDKYKESFVNLESLKKLNENTKFMNNGRLNIDSIKEIPPNFDFGNITSLRAKSASAWEIPVSVKFQNELDSFCFKDFCNSYKVLTYFGTLPNLNRKKIVENLIEVGILPHILKKWNAHRW